MRRMDTRRRFGMAACVFLATSGVRRVWAAEDRLEDIGPALSALEPRCGGRLGVGIIDTESGRTFGHRMDERFPMCSAHKALSAAAILSRVDAGQERLDRRVHFDANTVIDYSPVTKMHAGADGMTLAAICEAAITLSDNTAANLLFAALGGPAGVTAFLRGLGDGDTRLDRTEPTLNEALPGDPRDTTTPGAMARMLQRLVLGDALLPGSRAQLVDWLVAGRTGAARLRAGVPAGWRVGEKTGTNDHGTANDVGVLWPPGRAPLVVTVFVTASAASLEAQNAAIAGVARLVAEHV